MKCKFCGNDLPEESKFCPSCGAPVEPEEKQEQSEQSAEAKQQENQNPYEYGVPGTDNGSGAQNENPYQYGSAEQNNENPYQYGSEGQNNENPYQYGSAGQNNENPYQYGSTGQNTSADYNANNGTYGQPQKPINGTTYLIFAIITVLSATGHCGNCICLQNQFSTEKWRLCRSAECSKESEDVYDYRNSSCACSIYFLYYICSCDWNWKQRFRR